MAERQQGLEEQRQQLPTPDTVLSEELSEEPFAVPAEPTTLASIQQVEDGDGAEDDFGGFGDEFETGFDDFDEASFTPPVLAPVRAATNKLEQHRPSVDTVLASTSLLFAAAEDCGSYVEAIQQCLAQIFDGQDRLTAVPDDSSQISGLLSPGELESCLKKLTSTSTALASLEPGPRLLQNMLVVALSATLSDEVRARLLTPLSKLSIEEAQLLDEAPSTAAFYDIDTVRQIASGTEQATTAQLSQALCSLNALLADKEQEIARRKDAVLAYNQVIQTLVAQASKLH
ncbi:hypothetical protein IWW37_002988 [Coemansia sp. RSA 2050]|nr:hypothetical protein IWW37_002988 [Coemansia sp. RSA 2050]KAJ2733546.1 hypothetical protein IW152_003012 [Coemansia sp. BCRC 34962]